MIDILVTSDGWLRFGGLRFRCALGKGGCKPEADKREGDGATPLGRYPLRQVMYRPDRLQAPATRLPIRPLDPLDGWCDDPADPAYNRPVKLPYAASHEKLWRKDHVYDIIVELGHNDDPPIPGLGSAIFMHVARPDYTGTEGCIALALPDLQALLAAVPARAAVQILRA
ncbi:L,D-transpeptidase family protein [uncultured Ferrovibrio sp.]|jgi:L,D-peptidoglycan transpeptidase YkuD (ErfK/YbiS/YcfS/YnhG family)|uniref:L,D-transpeptidase family protein n=1 Tax=uncultured Ferrovibrio sp. TaxID=1576913 RepID=UPI00260FAB25|nr:L,D-transpeptidase family protein [uncultured Ferrovibrio sp.]